MIWFQVLPWSCGVHHMDTSGDDREDGPIGKIRAYFDSATWHVGLFVCGWHAHRLFHCHSLQLRLLLARTWVTG